MPQADLYVTADHTGELLPVLSAIEAVIRKADANAGDCKARVHHVQTYLHSHILLRLSMLPKAHRDTAFAERLGRDLIAILEPAGRPGSAINVLVTFDLVHYTALKITSRAAQ